MCTGTTLFGLLQVLTRHNLVDNSLAAVFFNLGASVHREVAVQGKYRPADLYAVPTGHTIGDGAKGARASGKRGIPTHTEREMQGPEEIGDVKFGEEKCGGMWQLQSWESLGRGKWGGVDHCLFQTRKSTRSLALSGALAATKAVAAGWVGRGTYTYIAARSRPGCAA